MEPMSSNIIQSTVNEPHPAHARAGGFDVHAGFLMDSCDRQDIGAVKWTQPMQGDSCSRSPNDSSRICCNQQFSITAVTTSAGAVTERYAYTAYGLPTILDASASVLSASAISNRYSYTGREWDATLVLHHFRARWMSPIAGRFLGRDPIGFHGVEQNAYSANGLPLSKADPSGHFEVNPHQPHRNRCIFIFDSNPVNLLIERAAKELQDFFPKTTFIFNPKAGHISRSEILDFIAKNKCCEAVFFGHQGGVRNPGGVMDGNEVMLPNFEFESQLNTTLTESCGNRKYDIYLYACGSLKRGANESEGKFAERCAYHRQQARSRRQRMRIFTGCNRIWAIDGEQLEFPALFPENSDPYPTPCDKLIGKKGPTGGFYVPINLSPFW